MSFIYLFISSFSKYYLLDLVIDNMLVEFDY